MSQSPPAYLSELSVALNAVHRASIITKQVIRSVNHRLDAKFKADASPVTVADFAAQALLIAAIRSMYPDDKFVAEEDAQQLRDNPALAEQVWELVQAGDTRKLQNHGAPLASPDSLEEMLTTIDLGIGESTSEGRVWVLDPIDGTATFMKGQQYAVCLCLLIDGVQHIGVIGCPNLNLGSVGGKVHEDSIDPDGYGIILSAEKGRGTFLRQMDEDRLGDARQVDQSTRTRDPSALDFVEPTIGKTSLSQLEHREVAESLGAKWPSTVIWSQQMKYVALALGATDVMVRIPKNRERFTYVWDHAGGNLLFEEAGGIIRDIDGGLIDFGQGRKILGERNFGMVAAMPWCFEKVMKAVNDVLCRRAK
ncbi:hypothetical protein DL765_005475 [Monosporascus sp. GIB2]|nr:hypothetical protein DL765_005475 [Monosporascus sp. GIB2]